VELLEHFEEGEVGPRVVNDSFGSVLDQEFEELKGLVDLAPFFGGLFGEALVDHGHDFAEELAGEMLLEMHRRLWRGVVAY
jgi:hypothetical protein